MSAFGQKRGLRKRKHRKTVKHTSDNFRALSEQRRAKESYFRKKEGLPVGDPSIEFYGQVREDFERFCGEDP